MYAPGKLVSELKDALHYAVLEKRQAQTEQTSAGTSGRAFADKCWDSWPSFWRADASV